VSPPKSPPPKRGKKGGEKQPFPTGTPRTPKGECSPPGAKKSSPQNSLRKSLCSETPYFSFKFPHQIRKTRAFWPPTKGFKPIPSKVKKSGNKIPFLNPPKSLGKSLLPKKKNFVKKLNGQKFNSYPSSPPPKRINFFWFKTQSWVGK